MHRTEDDFNRETADFHAKLAQCQGHTVTLPLDLAFLMVHAVKLMVEKGIPSVRHLGLDGPELISLNCLIDYEAKFKTLAKMVVIQVAEATGTQLKSDQP